MHNYTVRNNFWGVSGHADQLNSFKPGHVSFLVGQIYKINNS